MSKENNNPVKRQRRQDGCDTWAPPDEFRAVSLKAIADLLDIARCWLK
jgi:hypothetical protein